MNILLITLDQFRGDCLSVAGHPVAQTPHLDRLAREGLRLARHYAQAAPCGPARASLYTGLYQMNHRVVANGTPLDGRFDNLARTARRAGYRPTLFGYTDQAVDPRETQGPDDPRLASYEEVLPGFEVALHTPMGDLSAWRDWLGRQDWKAPAESLALLQSESERPEEASLAAFVTGAFIDWFETQEGPWFAHLSHFRPHPPYDAAGRFARMFESSAMPDPIAAGEDLHPLHQRLTGARGMAGPADADAARATKARYFGMIAEVDSQLGRLWGALEAAGAWDDTFIIVTADHGDQLGDHGLSGKGGFFEESYHIPGLVRDPRPGAARGAVLERFSEAIDIYPTLCEAMGVEVPIQCDGLPLTAFLHGEEPPSWRDAAYWEWDWRSAFISRGDHPWPWDRRLESLNLAVRRDADSAYVHFGDGSSLCFDLAADPTWRTRLADPAAILSRAQALLTWRARQGDRTLTGMLVEDGGIGRWPAMPPGWGQAPGGPSRA